MPESLLFLRCLEELRCFLPEEQARQLLLQALREVSAGPEDATRDQVLVAVDLILPRMLPGTCGEPQAEAIVAALRQVVEELERNAAVPVAVEDDRSTPVARLALKLKRCKPGASGVSS